jgi:23S rRNA pseudouridine2605 synthase
MNDRSEAGRRKRPARGKPGKPDRSRAEEVSSEPVKAQPARLHKVMAAAGLGSRRGMEEEIRDGKVQINDVTATLGQSLKINDRLKWGEREWLVVGDQSQQRSLVYNKPEGEITSRSDPEGRPTVFDRLPQLKDGRWVTIGRLDINTTGLLLLTTDGELANAMMHPSNQVDREYVCRVRGLVSDEQLAQLKEGVMLDDGPAHFNDITRMSSTVAQSGANQWFQVTLLEGRNREVRRLWESLNLMVSRLKRVRYGAAKLPRNLKMGQWQELTVRDHRVLREDVGLAEANPELSLQLVASHRHSSKKHTTRSSRAHEKRSSGAATQRPTGAAGKQGRSFDPAAERSADRKPRGARPAAKTGAAGRVADKRRTSKPGSPAGGGRRPGSKPRRGER